MNLEETFLRLSPTDPAFPNISVKDYISIYKNLKLYFDTYVHPEIKTKILEIEKSGYYNDHGVEHIKMVIQRVSWMLDLLDSNFLNSYESFILLVAINLHDAGHLISSREEHAKKGRELLARFDTGGNLDASEKKIIGLIAQAHSGKNDNPIGNLETVTHLSHKDIRPQFLAALLRLGDELAEDKTRASQFLLKLEDQGLMSSIEPTSEIFHRFSSSLDSIKLAGKEIKMKFYVQDSQLIKEYPMKLKNGSEVKRFLIDEIYERTKKTFLEALYCGRFLPEPLRFNAVKVEIDLLDAFHTDVHKPIKYELKEEGYPILPNSDIFEICSTLKTQTGDKIDGAYIKTQLSQNEESV
jgi:hypothetical protein